MSLRENDTWLESAKESFEEAVENEDWALARAIIGDCNEEGFKSAAEIMELELTRKQNELDASEEVNG